MATKPAFKIDSKGNLSVSGDFTFFKGDYTNAPTEEKLKDNLRTYLGFTSTSGRNLISDSEMLNYTVTSTSPGFAISQQWPLSLSQEELNSYVGKRIVVSYDISNLGNRTDYSDYNGDWRTNRFCGLVQGLWKDSTGTKTDYSYQYYGYTGNGQGAFRRFSAFGTLTPPAGYDTLFQLVFVVQLFCHPTNAEVTWIFANPKVEIGSMATAWSPNEKDFRNIAQINYLPVLNMNNLHTYSYSSYNADTGVYTLTAAQECASKFSQYYSYNIPCQELAGKQCRLHADSITTSKSSLIPRLYVQFYDISGTSLSSHFLAKDQTTKVFVVPKNAISFCYILRIDQNQTQAAGDTATFTKPKLEIDIGYNTPWCRSPLDWGRFEGGYIEKNLLLEKPRTNEGYLGVINQWTADKTTPAQVQMKIFTDKMGIWSKSEDGTTSWPIQTPLTTQDWTFTGTKAYNSSLFTVQAPTVKLDCTTVQLKSTGADIALKWGSSIGNMVLYNSGNIIMNGYIVQQNNRGNLEFRNSNGKTMGLFETISTAGEYKGLRIRSYSDASNHMPYVFIHNGQLDTRSVRCITISSSQPSSAKKGDIWIQPET